MKRLIVVACAAVLVQTANAQTALEVKPDNLGWIVTTAKRNEKPLLLKVRNEVPAGVQPATYPNVIEMRWKYAPDPNGLPAQNVITDILKFEAAIDPIHGDRAGYLMMIVTGEGERRWLWYVADPKIFAAALNRLVPGHPFPITLEAAGSEPDWKTYRTEREKLH